MTSKRWLQAVVAVLALVPVITGAAGVLAGPAAVAGAGSWPADLDSHFRYLSGIFFALGLVFYGCIPAIDQKTLPFRIAAALVVAGGAGRLISLAAADTPSLPHILGLGLELGVVPALVLWQSRVASGCPR